MAVGISNNAVKMMLEAVRQNDLGCGRWDVAEKSEGVFTRKFTGTWGGPVGR